MHFQTLVFAFLICAVSSVFSAATGDVPFQSTQTTLDASSKQDVPLFVQYPSSHYPEYANTGYENYLAPAGAIDQQDNDVAIPVTRMQMALKVLKTVGFYALWAAGIIFVGSLFTTAICTYTPLCTIQYHGLRGNTVDNARSIVNPESMSAAAEFVAKAVDKYQRIQ